MLAQGALIFLMNQMNQTQEESRPFLSDLTYDEIADLSKSEQKTFFKKYKKNVILKKKLLTKELENIDYVNNNYEETTKEKVLFNTAFISFVGTIVTAILLRTEVIPQSMYGLYALIGMMGTGTVAALSKAFITENRKAEKGVPHNHEEVVRDYDRVMKKCDKYIEYANSKLEGLKLGEKMEAEDAANALKENSQETKANKFSAKQFHKSAVQEK